MTAEQRKAHEQLCQTLPSRFHYMPDPPERGGSKGFGRANNRTAVVVNGKRYESFSGAARALKTTRQHISYLVRIGKADYAD